MRQTLFTIDPVWFEGRLLIAWLILGLLIFAYLYWQDQRRGAKQRGGQSVNGKAATQPGKSGEAFGFIPVYVVVALAIYFVLPRLQISDLDGNPAGLAVRGYGLFMLLAIVSGLGVAWWRCQQTRFPFETVLSVAFWMIICGIIGARIFYLVQKHRENPINSLSDLLWQLVDMTGGGLVVYGAIFGGTLAFFIVCWLKKFPALRIADIIAPAMAIGQALGRLGCLMNGCCFGGACDIDAIAIRFPPGSPPYMRQLETGNLLGIESRPLFQYPLVQFKLMDTNRDGEVRREEFDSWKADHQPAAAYEFDNLRFGTADSIGEGDLIGARVVTETDDISNAAIKDISVGDIISIYTNSSDLIRAVKQNELDTNGNPRAGNAIVFHQGSGFTIPLGDLPDWGTQIHPTQIYSAINAALIFLFLWFYFPFRRGHGEVFAWMLVLYAITRFCLESIRIDELPFLGPFSISQTISFPVLAAGLAMMWWVRRNHPLDSGNRTEPVP